MKKRGENQKGITLILLVVTIVVILILAAITVDLAFDENGIIKKAQGLQETINQSITNEEYELDKLTNHLEGSIINAGIGENPNINDIGGGGEESEVPQKPKIKINGTQGEEGYYRSDVEIVVTASDRAHTLTYTVEGTGIDQGSVETETSIGNGQSIKITGDGAYTIHIYAYNRNGQKSEGTTVTIVKDTVAPTATLAVRKDEGTTISVQLIAMDSEPSAGLASENPYTFYYQEAGNSTWEEAGKGSASSFTYTGLKENIGYILKAEVTDKAGNTGSSNEVESIKDETPPTINAYNITNITTNSITVEVEANDIGGSGILEKNGYTYYISTEPDFPENKTTIETIDEPHYTFTGIKDDTTYYMKVEVADKQNNKTTSETISAKTGSIPTGQGNITPSNIQWNQDATSTTPGTASITLTNHQPTYQMQYQAVTKGETPTETNWTTITTTSIEVTGLHHNDILYARLIDTAENAGNTTTVEIYDTDEPQAGSLIMRNSTATGEIYEEDTWTNQDVYIETCPGTDNQSGHKSTIAIKNTETLENPAYITEEGIHNIIVQTTDWAGKTASMEYTIKIDKTRPTIENVSQPNPSIMKEGETSQITITTSEPVELLHPENITLIGEGAQGATIETTISEDGTTITITVTAGTGNGEIQVHLPEGAIQDKAGNYVAEQTIQTIYIDNAGPTVTLQQGPKPSTISKGATSKTILVLSEPVTLMHKEAIQVTGEASEGCSVETTLSEDGLSITMIVTVGEQKGDIQVSIPQGTIVDKLGHPMEAYTITNMRVDEIAPEITTKYKDSTGEIYEQETWTNQNIYSEVTIREAKTVEKYQYSCDGVQWKDIVESTESQNGVDYTMQFPTDTTKPDFIGTLTASNATYHFIENGSGGIQSNNKGKSGSVASSYIPIYLEAYSEKETLNITVNATISGESSYDYGYATITNTTAVPAYTSSAGQFIKYAGSVTTKDYSVSLTGGKTYYLHIGYRKDGSGDKYNDEMVINSIHFQSDTINKGILFYNYTKNGNQIQYTIQDEIKEPFQIRAVYTDGTMSRAEECDIRIDRTAPTIQTIQAKTYQTQTEGSIEVETKEEESGIGAYYISTDPTEPTESSAWVEEENATFTIPHIQADTLYSIWVKDKMGNVSQVANTQITQAHYKVDSQYADTLQNAIEQASDTSTITLLQDYTDESNVNFTKDLTFDTGAYTLSRTKTITINNGKTVTIQGNGIITSGTRNIHTISNSGNLTLKGKVTIQNLSTSSSYSGIYNYVVTNIQEEATVMGPNGIYNNGSAYTVNMQGGTVKGTVNDGIYNGTVNITAGKIEGNRYGIYEAYDMSITIGDMTQEMTTQAPIVYGKTKAVYMNNANHNFAFYNGKLEADQQDTYTGNVQPREGYILYTYYGYEEKAYCAVLGTEISDIQIQADPTTWTNQDVKITIDYPTIENTTKQYSIDGINWKNTEQAKVIENVSENTTIYARMLDTNHVIVKETEMVIEHIDKIKPKITIEPATTHYYITDEQPTANIHFTLQVEEQGGSGIATQTYAWTTGEETPTYIDFANGIQVQKTVGEGKYYLWLQIADIAGNIAEISKVPFIVHYQAPVAQIGDTTYTTIQEAVDACEEGTQTTIILLKDTEEETQISENKNIVLDLQGYTIESANQAQPIIQNAGTLQIIDTSTAKTGKLEKIVGTAIENTGTLTIGDNTSEIENETPTIESNQIGIQNTGTFHYYDGAMIAKTPIDGNITDTPEGYGPVGTYENGKTKVTLDIVAEYVARIEYQYYTTLQNAIDACTAKVNNTNQQKITILKDIVLNQTATTYNGQNIKLDLDGYAITSSTIEKAIINNGDLEITDESIGKTGKIEISTSSREYCYGIWNNSTGRIKISRRNG